MSAGTASRSIWSYLRRFGHDGPWQEPKWRLAPENLPPFRPCVVSWEEMGATEMILEDTLIVWQPWGPYRGHAVDLGYSEDGRLIGIKIWDDVAIRKKESTDAV